MRVRVRACMHTCVRTCVRAYVRACMCVRVRARFIMGRCVDNRMEWQANLLFSSLVHEISDRYW